MRFFDLHCDTLGRCLDENKNFLNNNFHVDLLKTENFKPYIGCFAVFISDKIRGDSAFSKIEKAYKKLFDQQKKYSDVFKIIKTKNDLHDVVKNKKKGVVFTVEGGAALGGKLENIKILKNFGVKIMTLTWNGSCEFGDGIDVNPSKGLSEFGEKAVKEMEKQGIIVDVSHASEKLFYDVAKIAEKPFIATHSNSKEVCNDRRNLTNDQFKTIKNANGLVGINFCLNFLNKTETAHLSDVVSHTEHFLSLGGEKILAIGSDFDGTDVPEELSNVENVEKLCNYFLMKNYSEELVNNIFFNNACNFFIQNCFSDST